MNREWILKTFEQAINGECETVDIDCAIDSMYESYDDDKELDIDLITKAGKMKEYIPLHDERWRYNYPYIADGDYPLEKIPEHVRDLAKSLYYK